MKVSIGGNCVVAALGAIASVLVATAAAGQTSSWSSRLEGVPAADIAPPPGTVMMPRPPSSRARQLGTKQAPQSTKQAPLGGQQDAKASQLRPGKPPGQVFARPVSTSGGNDPAYVAFDNGHFMTALKLAEQAAAKGEPEAHTLIARIHAEGHGVRRDQKLAAQWYRRAADLGDPEGAFALGLMYLNGTSVEKDISAASALFERAAMTGHVWANYNLGMMFLSGRGKPENPVRGAQHIAYAAEKGIPIAQYDLATLYLTGHGVPVDGYMASRWLRRAVDQGMPEAQLDYAVMLLRGQGLNEDRADALRLLRLAADRGLAPAQNRLAHAILEGVGGLTRNMREVAMWRLLASEQGLDDEPLDARIKKLPAVDRAAAEAMADQWRERALLGPGHG